VYSAMILSDDVSGDYSTNDGTENDENCVEPRQKVTRSVHKTLRRMSIAALKGILLMIAFTGRDKTKLGKVKSSTQIRSILTKLMGN